MTQMTRSRGVVALLAAGFVLAACGAGATPTPAATQAPQSAAPTERVGPPPGQASSFVYAKTSAGLGDVPAFAALDVLRSKGYTIEQQEISESELLVEGVAANRFQFAEAANNPVLIAVEKGSNIKFVVDRNANEWGIITTANISSCEQLVASRVAIHSPGSVSGAMLKDWIKSECPDKFPEYQPLIIAGSQNRAAALLAGQIDASPVELRDAILLSKEGFKVLVDFATGLPKLNVTSIYTNGDWLAQNPDVAKDFIKELLLQHRRVNTEPGYLLEQYKKYFPEEVAQDPALAEEAVDEFIKRELFRNNGGLTTESMDYTAQFFGPDGTGDTTKLLTASDISDLSYLNAVLEEIGRK
jgi:NitT/TauT family transport system substrate-binding protein